MLLIPFWALAIDPFLILPGPARGPSTWVGAGTRAGNGKFKKGSTARAQEGIESKGNIIDIIPYLIFGKS